MIPEYEIKTLKDWSISNNIDSSFNGQSYILPNYIWKIKMKLFFLKWMKRTFSHKAWTLRLASNKFCIWFEFKYFFSIRLKVISATLNKGPSSFYWELPIISQSYESPVDFNFTSNRHDSFHITECTRTNVKEGKKWLIGILILLLWYLPTESIKKLHVAYFWVTFDHFKGKQR